MPQRLWTAVRDIWATNTACILSGIMIGVVVKGEAPLLVVPAVILIAFSFVLTYMSVDLVYQHGRVDSLKELREEREAEGWR